MEQEKEKQEDTKKEKDAKPLNQQREQHQQKDEGNYDAKATGNVSNNIFIGSIEASLSHNNNSSPPPIANQSVIVKGGVDVATNATFPDLINDNSSQQGVTLSAGEMSPYSSEEEDRVTAHPGMLVLAAGILLSVTALGTLASRVSRRRRAELYSRQRDIEVSSITGVAELW